MKVTIFGPNLNDQSRGTFHVHAAGCQFERRYGPGTKYGGDGHGWTIDVESRWEATEAVYCDVMTDDPDYYATAEARQDLIADLWFSSCLDDLPNGQVGHDLGNDNDIAQEGTP